ncbi:DUF4397 domain-containing protein [Sphingobacterium sp. LRF_L2]|uniref:DUF4397 domain-containing protein n=1 Tax=Sphingobacterium sp. LRF_L2 TaxID=3369421 RepID=UPI003F5FC156
MKNVFSTIYRTLVLCIFFSLFVISCKKDKLDYTYDHSPEVFESSAVRLVNLVEYSQVSINDELLTNTTGTPTTHFKTDGALENTWWIPQDMFAGKKSLDLAVSGRIRTVAGVDSVYEPSLRFTVNNQAMDYYTIWPGGRGQANIVPVERDNAAPSRSDYFKIRIVNLAKQVEPLSAAYPSYTGALENLVSAITLTYADGTPVSDATSNISVGKRTSEYIELPYGTYQFKILTTDGRQISATVHGKYEDPEAARLLDPATSRIPMVIPGAIATTQVTGLTYAPMQAYQPGGVYTLVVAPFRMSYRTPASLLNQVAFQNQFKIIEDNVVPVNQSLARVQVVNAMPGSNVSFRLNGMGMGSTIAFGGTSDYSIIPAGTYTVEAESRVGNVAEVLSYPIGAGQNHTVWLFPDENGNPKLDVVVNDLSGTLYDPWNEDDGANNRYQYTMAFGIRYLNLCPDVPYLSFTINNGQDMRDYWVSNIVPIFLLGGSYVFHLDESMYNLTPGKIVKEFPYSWWRWDTAMLFEFMAYRSTPAATPGVWAKDIPTVPSTDLIKRPELYWAAGRAAPTYEPGIYTFALIGRTGDNVPDEQKARILIVKHNR